MMTAAAYVSQIVEPTLEDFRRHRADLRRGMLASMAVLHVVDFVMQNCEATPEAGDKAVAAFKKRIEGTHPGFDTVNKFALASKHGALRRDPGFDTDRHRITSPAFFGRFQFGRSFLGDTTGGLVVTLGEGRNVNLLRALDATMDLYRAEFPEAFATVGDGSMGEP